MAPAILFLVSAGMFLQNNTKEGASPTSSTPVHDVGKTDKAKELLTWENALELLTWENALVSSGIIVAICIFVTGLNLQSLKDRLELSRHKKINDKFNESLVRLRQFNVSVQANNFEQGEVALIPEVFLRQVDEVLKVKDAVLFPILV